MGPVRRGRFDGRIWPSAGRPDEAAAGGMVAVSGNIEPFSVEGPLKYTARAGPRPGWVFGRGVPRGAAAHLAVCHASWHFLPWGTVAGIADHEASGREG